MHWMKVFSVAIIVIATTLVAGSYSVSQDIDRLSDNFSSLSNKQQRIDPDQIDPDPVFPIDPCLGADVVASIKLSTTSDTSARDGNNFYIQSIAHPFSVSGKQIGYMKMEYNNINVSNVNGSEGIDFVTVDDTFYFTEANLTAFGKRVNNSYGKYKGNGSITKLINNENSNVSDVNISYKFNFVDRQEREICFYIHD